jgi:UDP-N-acetylmuramoyl-L-alanyl-D-glutamate--2,6-diaminopimelate ligase
MNIQRFKNLFWHLPQSIFWNFYYSFPSRKLTLIGVTGTDGKTTTCTLMQKLLENSGLKCGIISTLSAQGLHTTSPDPKDIQKILFDYQKQGFTHVVCEVTSHALDQYRYWGCHFKIGIFTNLSHEHLDYHHTINNYLKAKAKLFSQSDLAVINHDDPLYSQLKSLISIPCVDYGVKNKSDFTATEVKVDSKFLTFNINHQKFTTDSNYEYQIYNILACYSAFSKLNLHPQVFKDTILNFPETKGRRENVLIDPKIKTIIDFAHTPNALKVTLSSLKKLTPGRLLVIFGATGGRDQSKRPIMGEVVSKLADIAFITADDTRHEKIEDINRQIISGINSKKSFAADPLNPIIKNPEQFYYFNIPNRQDAFNLAVKIAKANDTVVACGKGHETTILHGSTEYPWSEAEAFRSAFRLKNQNV